MAISMNPYFSIKQIARYSICLLPFLGGCTTLSEPKTTVTASLPTEKLDTILKQQRMIIANLNQQPEKVAQQAQMIARLEAKLSKLEQNSADLLTPKQQKAEKVELPQQSATPDRLVLGQEEWIWFSDIASNLAARVDTGATTSSVSAKNITLFKRDGKKWVSFNLLFNQQESKQLEAKVVRTIQVTQSNSATASRRYVIELPIAIGSLQTHTQFTLTDRSHMTYPVLLGRSFLHDIALVDVAKTYTQTKKTLTPTDEVAQ